MDVAHVADVKPRRWIVGVALWLAACGAPSPRVAEPLETGVKSAWVELGPDGVASARAITAATDGCPPIVLDGKAEPMMVRAPPGTAPLRSTLSEPADSKPSAFPVTAAK